MTGISSPAFINPFNSIGSSPKKAATSVNGGKSANSLTPSPATKAIQDMVISRFLSITQSMNETLFGLNPSSSSASATDPLAGLGDLGNADMQNSNHDSALASSINYLLAITNNNPSAVQSYLKMTLLPTDLFGSSNTRQSFINNSNSAFQSPGSIIDQLL